MIAITTRSSTKVKARDLVWLRISLIPLIPN
jgi:hypothetical protein